MAPSLKIVLGVMLSGFVLLVGWWFWRNYYRIGPEETEPFVFLGGAAVILAALGGSVLLLIKGAKQL